MFSQTRWRRVKPSETRLRNVAFVIFARLQPEDGGSRLFRNACNYLLTNTELYFGTLRSLSFINSQRTISLFMVLTHRCVRRLSIKLPSSTRHGSMQTVHCSTRLCLFSVKRLSDWTTQLSGQLLSSVNIVSWKMDGRLDARTKKSNKQLTMKHTRNINPKTVFPYSKTVFLNRQAAARYRALASIIPDREKISWNLTF